MKTFLFLLIPILFLMTLTGFLGSIDQAGEREFVIWLSVFIFSFALLTPSYFKYVNTEDDFLFLWVKTKSKRLRERKESAKEAMRKELEED